MATNNNTLNNVIVAVSSTTADSLSTVACLLATGALLYFKMYRLFAYRLVLYTLVTLTIFSFIGIVYLLIIEIVISHGDPQGFEVVGYLYTGCFFTALSLMSASVFYIRQLDLNFKPHNKLVYDLNYCLVSLLVPVAYTGAVLIGCYNSRIDLNNTSPLLTCTDKKAINSLPIAVFVLFFGINVIFIAAVLVSLCTKAYGCKAVAVLHEHYQRALKETLSLFIVPIFSLTYAFFGCVNYMVPSDKNGFVIRLLFGVFGGLIGLVAALSFVLHLCILGKAKLRNLRGNTKWLPPPMYGAINPNPEHSAGGHTTTAPYIQESEYDNRILLGRARQL